MFQDQPVPITAAWGGTLLRVSLGTMYLAHAGLKYFIFTPEGTAGFFASVGVAPAMAYVTIAAETIGGIMLIAGIYTRLTALALIPILLGTILFVHGANGWQFGAEGGGWEYPAFLIAASLVQALIGGGALSLRRSAFLNPAARVA